MNQQSKQILIVIVVLCLGMLIAAFIWQGDSLYSGAYAPMVEQSNDRKAIEKHIEDQEAPPSVEPQAPGFKERDIDKQKGNGFNTY